MFRKFLNGFVFGAGFAFAFLIMVYIGFQLVPLSALDSTTKEPVFSQSEIEQAETSAPSEVATRDFELYTGSGARMEVPERGGILAINLISTPEGNKQPSTFQLWISESEFWQIKTSDSGVEVEKLEYPAVEPIEAAEATMSEKAGGALSYTTVSYDEVSSLEMGYGSGRDQDMNGKIKITEEGVVYFQPNEY